MHPIDSHAPFSQAQRKAFGYSIIITVASFALAIFLRAHTFNDIGISMAMFGTPPVLLIFTAITYCYYENSAPIAIETQNTKIVTPDINLSSKLESSHIKPHRLRISTPWAGDSQPFELLEYWGKLLDWYAEEHQKTDLLPIKKIISYLKDSYYFKEVAKVFQFVAHELRSDAEFWKYQNFGSPIPAILEYFCVPLLAQRKGDIDSNKPLSAAQGRAFIINLVICAFQEFSYDPRAVSYDLEVNETDYLLNSINTKKLVGLINKHYPNLDSSIAPWIGQANNGSRLNLSKSELSPDRSVFYSPRTKESG